MDQITQSSSSNRNGAVTFLDILGWKGIWQRKDDPAQDLQTLAHMIENSANDLSRGLGSGATILSTKVLIISDTIVISTDATLTDAQYALDLHGKLCQQAIPESINLGIPVRGATCFGEFSINNDANILVGKAIDEAASWRDLADWIGVFMSPSAAYVFDGSRSSVWSAYPPPLRNGVAFQTYAVRWFQPSGEMQGELLSLKKKFTFMSPIIPEFIAKFQNTLNFIKELQKPKNIK